MCEEKKPEEKITVGHAVIDASKTDMQSDAIELQREIHAGKNSDKSYEEEVFEALDRGKKDDAITGDFFVVVLTKKERHLRNVIRNLFFYRKSCPRPEFDQCVYHYHRKDDVLEFLWVVPNVATCNFIPMYKGSLPSDHDWLVSMIDEFNSGKLDELCNKLNSQLDK